MFVCGYTQFDTLPPLIYSWCNNSCISHRVSVAVFEISVKQSEQAKVFRVEVHEPKQEYIIANKRSKTKCILLLHYGKDIQRFHKY